MAKEVFAKRLVELREKNNISQSELAEYLGVTRQSLSLYETAERTINIDLLEQIAKYFNVSADYLIGISDAPSLDIEMKAVCKYTGLSEKAVVAVKEMCNYISITSNDSEFNYYKDSLNSILSSDKCLFDNIGKLKKFSKVCTEKSVIYKTRYCFDKLYDILCKSDIYVDDNDTDYIKAIAHRISSFIIKKQEQYPIHKIDAESKKILNAFNCNVFTNYYEQCDLLRYNTSRVFENFINMCDERLKIEQMSDNEFLNYLGITQEEFEQLKYPNKGGNANGGDTSAQE